jgi:hypothetical protein
MAERNEDSIFEALNKKDPTYMSNRYPTTKLLEVFMVRALASRLSSGSHADQPVILNCLNPGLCHSSLSREAKGLMAVMFTVMKFLLARTTEVGSRTLVASAEAGKESHGQYMSNCVVTEPSAFVRSEEGLKTQERVYTELMAILEVNILEILPPVSIYRFMEGFVLTPRSGIRKSSRVFPRTYESVDRAFRAHLSICIISIYQRSPASYFPAHNFQSRKHHSSLPHSNTASREK